MSSPTAAPKKKLMQTINYTGSDSEFCTEIQGEVINIHCNEGNHNHGSSKVKLIDRIDYNWELGYYQGHLVAAHINGKVVAYGMKGKDGGMLRVTNQETNHRTLIKNLKEDIKDIAFAYSRDDILLGCVDSEGNILVYEIIDLPNSITYALLLHVYHEEPLATPKPNYRLIWCPYLPNFDEDLESSDDPEKMFVVLNGTRAEVYNVMVMTNKYGKGGPLDPDDTFTGYIEINHIAELVDASFSSDGTAIAIACKDGFVKFFQLYMLDAEKQKCLHEWQPHDGQPLSSIIFIDNILEYSSECWKFTITGANNNSEIKLWSCESWTCLQTIHFEPNPKSVITNLYLNIAIDYTGQYLVISDINNRVIYVMQLKRNDEEQVVCVTLLAQFLLPAPFLGYHILEAGIRKIPFCYSNSTEELYDNDEEYEEDAEVSAIALKMLVIQPKKFQECNILFQPEALMHQGVNKSESISEKIDEEEKLVEIEELQSKIPNLDDLQSSVTLLIKQQSNNKLFTPEDFTVPSQNSRPNSSGIRNSLTNENSLNKSLEALDCGDVDFQRPQKDNFASAGSSPSREVQEIMSLNNSATNFGTDEYFDNLASLQEQEQPQKEYSNLTNVNDTLTFQDSMSWPKLPVLKDSELINDTTVENELSKSQIQSVNFRIDALENIIREQNILIQKLLQDMKTLTQAVGRNSHREEKEEWVKELDCAMSKQHLQIAKMLENLVNMQKTKDREMQEQIVSAVSQILTKSVSEKMQQILQQEIKHVVLPTIHSLIETYRHQIDTQYSQKFSNIDSVVRENFAKVINSKALSDSLSLSIVNVVSPSLEKCYRDVVSSSLIPSWERVCSQMFQQINDTFTKGTKEYTASVENYMDRQRRVQEKGKDLIVQMQTVSDSMKTNADKLSGTLTTDIQKQFNAIFKIMQEKVTQNVKEVVSEQIKQGFKSHAAFIEDSVLNAVRSRAVTPSPQLDNHMTTLNHIQQSLARGKFDEAFQLALSAENLTYVIYVCERVDINKLFGEECLLQQSCLLAMIQQLSMELHKNTDLKLNFIRAAFLALSPDSPHTKQFVPKVLKDLLKQLALFMQSNPSMKHATEARLLKMAVESMMGK